MILIIAAVILDWLLGDPYFFPHPVRLMGFIITIETKFARFISKKPSTLRFFGFLMVLINLAISIFPMYFVLKVTEGPINSAIKIITYYFCISAKMLSYEAKQVKKATLKSVDDGRNRLKYIVGRDTKDLEIEEIITATVETVSENTSDGIIAPLFYILLFGPVGGLTYKFINTMDSMIGYKDKKYVDIGRYAAKLDDIVNFIPARITAFLMCLAAINPKIIERSFTTVLKDAKKHKSPNAGYPEAAIAGILGIQLGGGHVYHGMYVEKPYIGKNLKNPEFDDIDKTIQIMYKTEIIFLIIAALIFGIMSV